MTLSQFKFRTTRIRHDLRLSIGFRLKKINRDLINSIIVLLFDKSKYLKLIINMHKLELKIKLFLIKGNNFHLRLFTFSTIKYK